VGLPGEILGNSRIAQSCAEIRKVRNEVMTTISDIPPELNVEYDRVAYQGKGVQIYQCGPDGKWLFQAPRASLYDDDGHLVAEHFSGPTWQAADGSTVVGRVISKAAPDPTAIPWLLLEAASSTGDGFFSKVKYIQRLNTVGGKAPSESCEVPQLLEIKYLALYVFHLLRTPGIAAIATPEPSGASNSP
jgi:Protein of unknown function (DUF3455)